MEKHSGAAWLSSLIPSQLVVLRKLGYGHSSQCLGSSPAMGNIDK